MIKKITEAVKVVPSKRQLDWHETPFNAFVHFGMNTFTNREWGTGKESPSLFNPIDLDVDSWIKHIKSAGMSGAILTAKHHDGFCLWPSKYTEHSVKNSPWKNGEGDVVKEFSEACRKYNIKFGIYLSPWDRHDERYGSDEYNTYYINQLRELLAGYGEVFEVWFDNACTDKGRQTYAWADYYRTVRELMPDAVISNFGPDVRWCGNESGFCRKNEWSVVPYGYLECEFINDNGKMNKNGVNFRDIHIGERSQILSSEKLIWYPSETDTSIRPNWFYHKRDDRRVRTLNNLLNLYFESVGGNSSLLLNIPPDKEGRFHKTDIERLNDLGHALKRIFSNNILNEAKSSSVLTYRLNEKTKFNIVVIRENIMNGQRVEAFVIEIKKNEKWKTIYNGTTVGNRKICLLKKAEAEEVRLRITKSRDVQDIKTFELYYDTGFRRRSLLLKQLHRIKKHLIDIIDKIAGMY